MTKNLIFSVVFFIVSFIVLSECVGPLPEELAEASQTDDGQYIKDYFDRSIYDALFSVSKKTFDENANTHYVPLNNIFFKILFNLHTLFGIRAHAVLFLIHFWNAILFYKIMKHYLEFSVLIYAGTYAFIILPLEGALLTWFAAGFNHIITMFFCLASCYTWIQFLTKQNKRLLIVSVITALCAYALKPLAYFLPLSLACLAFSEKRVPATGKVPWRNILYLIPHFLLLLPFACIEALKYPGGNVARTWGGIELGIHPLLRILDLLTYYFIQTPISPVARECIMFLIFFCAIYLLITSCIHRHGVTLFGLSWTVASAALMLSTNFRETETILRYLYFPVTGMILLICVTLNTFFTHVKIRYEI